jgi:hypothetical protein
MPLWLTIQFNKRNLQIYTSNLWPYFTPQLFKSSFEVMRSRFLNPKCVSDYKSWISDEWFGFWVQQLNDNINHDDNKRLLLYPKCSVAWSHQWRWACFLTVRTIFPSDQPRSHDWGRGMMPKRGRIPEVKKNGLNYIMSVIPNQGAQQRDVKGVAKLGITAF